MKQNAEGGYMDMGEDFFRVLQIIAGFPVHQVAS
jgi:hypothetical protein